MRRCSAGTCRRSASTGPVLRDNVLAEVGRLEGAYTETLTNHDVTIFNERATLAGPEFGQARVAARRSPPTRS